MEVDITLPENRPWYNKYRYDIPVLHLNGLYFAKHRVSVEQLNAGLEAAARGDVVIVDGDPNSHLPAPTTPLQ